MAELPVLSPALPEIFLAVATMALLLAGGFLRRSDASRRIGVLAFLVLVAVLAVALFVGGDAGRAFGGLFIVDSFALYLKVLILGASALTLLMSGGYLRREGMNRFEYPVLICFAALGMMLMVSANDFMALYIGIELQSLSLYVMAAFRRDSTRSTEAGLKYFVLGAVASGLLLYGCSLIYGFTGQTGFEALAVLSSAEAAPPVGVVIGLVFVLAALAFKVSGVPFHMWAPDVYEGAPTTVTAFFAVAPKIAAIGVLVRLSMVPFAGLEGVWTQVVIVIAVLSMSLGAVAAIAQTNIKRMMAYSAIGHVGYALIGVAAGTEEGVHAVLVYLAIYAIMNIGVFAAILCMKVRDQMVEDISALAGLKNTRPGFAAVLMVLMFSMAGVPPMAGFFGKFLVFKAAVDADLTWLAIVGAIASVVSAFYYLRIIKTMYFDPPLETLDPVHGVSLRIALVGAGIASATLIFWLPALSAPALYAASRLGF